MNWFEEQLRYREETDNKVFAEAVESIAEAVMGEKLLNALGKKEIAGSAIDEILKYYHVKPKEVELPPEIETIEQQLEYRLHPLGIMYRNVTLEKGWYHDAIGAMLGTLKDEGAVVVLVPNNFFGYKYLDIRTGKWKNVNRKTAQLLDSEAICFYEPLPMRKLNIMDLAAFMLKQLNMADIALYLLMMLIVTLLGTLTPQFTKWLFGDVLQSGKMQVLLSLAVFMVCFSISKLCISAFQSLINSKISIKMDVAVEAAVMNRIMSLPASFFKDYASGELFQRSAYFKSLCSILCNAVGVTGLTSLFSLIYIGQIMKFTPSLVVPALLVTFLSALLTLATTLMQIRITRAKMMLSTKTSGMTYSTITGIQKIKLAGAEKRMFTRWAKQYALEAEKTYNIPLFLKLSKTLSLVLSLAGTLILYMVSINNGISVDDYYAFNSAYAMVSSAFLSLASVAITIADITPTLEMAKPIMESEPEMQTGAEIVNSLRGGIELNHVSFRYTETMPNVIDDLSLKIAPGEYIALVGSTGCGKSTLMRLLLGFEKPQKGSIFYGRKDLSRVNMYSLRRKIGVVMQNGKLFQGDIFSNIMISAPALTLKDAWEAAEMACFADDIKAMPMGMNTLISEGQGGISGGQKQRLMIARAIASKPRVLMFDEATSALDNVTQKKVTEAIDTLKCTRIVIAHRLSTIRHADRILFLKGGKIAEEGTYEELIAKNGLFAELVERQRLDVDVE